jgi:hypothetical protein
MHQEPDEVKKLQAFGAIECTSPSDSIMERTTSYRCRRHIRKAVHRDRAKATVLCKNCKRRPRTRAPPLRAQDPPAHCSGETFLQTTTPKYRVLRASTVSATPLSDFT